MSRVGAANPFFGRRHTDEWKRQASARQTEWTSDDLVMLRRWYLEREGKPLRLAELCVLLGRPKTSLCRTARTLGLTHISRPTGRKVKSKYPTPEASRAAIGRSAKKRIEDNGHPRGMLGKKHTRETVERVKAGTKAWRATVTPEQQAEITDRTQATLMERYGTLAPGHDSGANPYSRSRYGNREDLGGQFFRSRWEANYARFLNWLIANNQIAKWEYEPETFWFHTIKRGVRSYKPDFRITETDGKIRFDEVKGWMDAKSKTKMARMAKYYPEVDLRLVDERAYREIEKKVGKGLDGWE